MSEVHRYKVVKMLSEAGNGISYDPHGPYVVLADDYDAALAREAALREDLEHLKVVAANVVIEGYALQQRLTVARRSWAKPMSGATATGRTALTAIATRKTATSAWLN